VAKPKPSRKTPTRNQSQAPGIGLETMVARIQQMMDPSSTVTHNEVLEDRLGNCRQFDVVIRGCFGGRPVVGVMECKDHSRRKGPDAVEAFAKKADHLRANLRIMVSKKGFTKQALILARHENVGCVSLLPKDPAQVGFSVGAWWFGELSAWTKARLVLHFTRSPAPLATFDSGTVTLAGKQVVNWFSRELQTTYANVTMEGEHALEVAFGREQNIEIAGEEYSVTGISCIAVRVYRKKRKWASWSGDAFYDWHSGQIAIPPGGTLVGGGVETDLTAWPDYEGELPGIGENVDLGLPFLMLHSKQTWDYGRDDEVPELCGREETPLLRFVRDLESDSRGC
jgi:hypothetical protein